MKSDDLTLRQAQDLALKVRDHYSDLQKKDGQKQWAARDRFDGMIGDIGTLAKLLMAKDNIRRGPENIDEEITHEMNDLLWSVLVLADEAGVDIISSFPDSMNELNSRIEREKSDKNLWKRNNES